MFKIFNANVPFENFNSYFQGSIVVKGSYLRKGPLNLLNFTMQVFLLGASYCVADLLPICSEVAPFRDIFWANFRKIYNFTHPRFTSVSEQTLCRKFTAFHSSSLYVLLYAICLVQREFFKCHFCNVLAVKKGSNYCQTA